MRLLYEAVHVAVCGAVCLVTGLLARDLYEHVKSSKDKKSDDDEECDECEDKK